MTFSDIFNTSFFVCLGICLILVLSMFLYFSQMFSEQNHKISSMFSLVSTMADELNQMKYKLDSGVSYKLSSGGDNAKQQIYSQLHNNGLIPVSDDEDDANADDDENTEFDDEISTNESENNESLIEDDDVGDEDDDDDDSVSSEKSDEQIKVIKINYETNQKDNIESESMDESEIENLSAIDDADADADIDCDDLDESIESKSVVDLDIDLETYIEESRLINSDETKEEVEHHIEQKQDHEENKELLKTININLEDDVLDYKKLSLNKLRIIVVEKGLVEDSSKLKKNELLKLLGSGSD